MIGPAHSRINSEMVFSDSALTLTLLFQGGPGSVRFGYGLGWTGSSGSGFRFRRFLCKKGFSVFQYSLTGKDGSSSGFGSWKAVPVPLSVSGKSVPTVPVPGSGSVPEPP